MKRAVVERTSSTWVATAASRPAPAPRARLEDVEFPLVKDGETYLREFGRERDLLGGCQPPVGVVSRRRGQIEDRIEYATLVGHGKGDDTALMGHHRRIPVRPVGVRLDE